MKRTYITLLLAAVAMCTFADAPNGSGTYYQAANGKKGSALKTALRDIVQTNTELDYDYLWTAFRTTDKRSDGKVWDMYSNITNFTFGTDQAGNYQKEGDVYNREHSFPKSWFGGEIKPMYTDLHHMYPTDGYVNNRRDNFPFGEVSSPTYSSANGFSKLGPCSVNGYTGTVFEPNNEYKGDFARTYFYMVTCYEEKLADWYSKNSESRATIDGTKYPAFQTWQLNMLLKWAKNDPVSEKEINRNNAVYGIQNNRNPFIDYPGLEQYIWGSKKTDAFSYDNYVQPTIWSTEYNSSGSGGDDPGPSGLVTDVIDLAFTGVPATAYYAEWSGKKGSASSAVYAGQSAGSYNSVQLRSSNNNSGIISTTSGGKLTKVSVTWNSNTISGRTLNVYGKNTAYTAVTDLYNSSTQGTLLGTIVKGTSTVLTISGNYEYIGLRSGSDPMYFDKIEITWDSGSSLEASDLTLSASSLSFDLSNNASAQTISYTTSSTGAVTVSGGEGYVTTSVNESTKTITVAPLAKTTSPQTITVSQAADETYEAGSVTFTVTVGDSTPVPSSGGWIETSLANLTASDVFVIVGTNSNGSYALPSNGGIYNAPAAIAVTIVNGKITSDVADNLKWNISGNASNGYIFYPNGSTTTWLYCSTTKESKDNENMRVGTANKRNKFVLDENGYLVTKDSYVARYLSIYVNNGTPQDWRGYINTSSGAVPITFYKYVAPSAPTSIPVFVSELGCGTFASDFALDFSNSEIRAFYATVSGDNLIFHEIQKVPANTGVLLYKVGGASDDIPVYSGTADAVPGNANAFVRGTGAAVSYTDQDKNYILFDGDDGLGFYKAKNNTVATNRAYIHVPVSVNVKCFLLDLENDPTGIESIQNSKFKIQNEDAIYNLAGQRLSKMQKGINIINGKKVLR